MLSLIQWEMWLGDQMLPIYPRLAGWFFLCLLQKTHHSSLNKEASYQKKILIYFQCAKRWLQKPQCLNNKWLKGLGGAQSVKRHCEGIRSWLWIPNAQIKRQVQWRMPEEEVTGQSLKLQWPASPAQLISSRFSDRSCLQKQGGEWLKPQHWPCMCTHI